MFISHALDIFYFLKCLSPPKKYPSNFIVINREKVENDSDYENGNNLEFI